MTVEIYLKNAERTPILLAGDWRVVNFLNLAFPNRVKVSCREYAAVIQAWIRVGELLDEGFVADAQDLYDTVYFGPFGCLVPSRFLPIQPLPGEAEIDSTDRADIDAILERIGFNRNAGKMVARVVMKHNAKPLYWGDEEVCEFNVRLGERMAYVKADSYIRKGKKDFVEDWKYQARKLAATEGEDSVSFSDVVKRMNDIGWNILYYDRPQEGVEWME